jgi:hypothetical protein
MTPLPVHARIVRAADRAAPAVDALAIPAARPPTPAIGPTGLPGARVCVRRRRRRQHRRRIHRAGDRGRTLQQRLPVDALSMGHDSPPWARGGLRRRISRLAPVGRTAAVDASSEREHCPSRAPRRIGRDSARATSPSARPRPELRFGVTSGWTSRTPATSRLESTRPPTGSASTWSRPTESRHSALSGSAKAPLSCSTTSGNATGRSIFRRPPFRRTAGWNAPASGGTSRPDRRTSSWPISRAGSDTGPRFRCGCWKACRGPPTWLHGGISCSRVSGRPTACPSRSGCS